mmetsp:Transcript_26278/g.64919  ORF Transcript_26278/g.64919 Transcript_26278/m.64919 type:complete len:239 (+) Transcript_26278:2372-3088(+)
MRGARATPPASSTTPATPTWWCRSGTSTRSRGWPCSHCATSARGRSSRTTTTCSGPDAPAKGATAGRAIARGNSRQSRRGQHARARASPSVSAGAAAWTPKRARSKNSRARRAAPRTTSTRRCYATSATRPTTCTVCCRASTQCPTAIGSARSANRRAAHWRAPWAAHPSPPRWRCPLWPCRPNAPRPWTARPSPPRPLAVHPSPPRPCHRSAVLPHPPRACRRSAARSTPSRPGRRS